MSDAPWIFFLPDLHEFPEGSLPSPYPLMNPVRRLPSGSRLVAIGWLDGPNEFPKGVTDPGVVRKLLRLGEAFLIDEGTRGYHSCYYCQDDDSRIEEFTDDGEILAPWDFRPQSPFGKGHHLIRLGDTVYMCPSLLPHYLVVHGYRPPEVFQEAVLKGVVLADADLIHTGEDCLEFALEQSVAKAEAQGDTVRVSELRARIAARREELRLAGRTSGFKDRDTGVWRDR